MDVTTRSGLFKNCFGQKACSGCFFLQDGEGVLSRSYFLTGLCPERGDLLDP